MSSEKLIASPILSIHYAGGVLDHSREKKHAVTEQSPAVYVTNESRLNTFGFTFSILHAQS